RAGLGHDASPRAGWDQADRERARRDRAARDPLAQRAHVEPAATRPAVLLGDRHSQPAELRDSLVHVLIVRLASVLGERVALLPGPAFALGEVADRLDERTLFVGERLDRH